MAALKVTCCQKTQVQTEHDNTDRAFSRIKLETLQNSCACRETSSRFLAYYLGSSRGKYCYLACWKKVCFLSGI